MGRSRYNYSLATLVLEYGNKEWPNLQDNPQPGLFFRGYLLAQAFFLLPQLRSEILAKILRLKHLRNSGHLHSDTFHLYEAVLVGGAREPAEVRAWLDRDAEN